jgi:hypothetical protein
MVVKIFIDKPVAPDELCGLIDAEGDVYDEKNCLIGWAEDDGTIIAYYVETEEEIEVGYVTEDGEIYYYDEDEKDQYFGRLKKLQSFVEGAAALLFFLDREE